MEALLCRTRVPARALHLHSFVCALRSMVSPPSNRIAHFLFSVCSASIRSSCCFRKRTISAASTFLFFVAIASDCFVFFFVSLSFSLESPRSPLFSTPPMLIFLIIKTPPRCNRACRWKEGASSQPTSWAQAPPSSQSRRRTQVDVVA